MTFFQPGDLEVDVGPRGAGLLSAWRTSRGGQAEVLLGSPRRGGANLLGLALALRGLIAAFPKAGLSVSPGDGDVAFEKMGMPAP